MNLEEKLLQVTYNDDTDSVIDQFLNIYKDTPADLISNLEQRNILRIYNRKIKVSNIFFRNAFMKIYSQYFNSHPINMRESSILMADNLLDKELNEDLGLIIYPIYGPNEGYRKDLTEQVVYYFKDRIDINMPFVISGLIDVDKDYNLEYGLRLFLTDLTEVYNVDSLCGSSGRFSLKYINSKTGFPKRIGNGDKYLSLSDNGIRRVMRIKDCIISCENYNLVKSNEFFEINFIQENKVNNVVHDIHLKEIHENH